MLHLQYCHQLHYSTGFLQLSFEYFFLFVALYISTSGLISRSATVGIDVSRIEEILIVF